MKLQIRHLHYFIAVAEELNFRKASDRVFVSQPTLSHQIAQLEDILGIKLLIRDKRHVEVTAAGELFYEKSQLILQTIDISISQIQELALHKTLKIGVPNYHSFNIVSNVLQRFTIKHPNIPLEIKEMSALDMNDALHKFQIDFGFLALPFPSPGSELLNVKLIDQEAYLFCLSKKNIYCNLSTLNASTLKESKFILLPRNVHPEFYDYILDQLKSLDIEPNVVAEATSTQAQYSLVAAEMGVCLALESSPIPNNNLTVLPLDPPILQHKLTIASHKENQCKEVKYFLSCIDSIVST